MVLISWLPVSKEQGETLPMIVPSNPSSNVQSEETLFAQLWPEDKMVKKEMIDRSSANEQILGMITHNSERWCQLQVQIALEKVAFFVSLHTQSFHTYHVWSCLIIADHFLSFLFLMCSYVFFFYVIFDFLSFVSIFCPPRCRRCK